MQMNFEHSTLFVTISLYLQWHHTSTLSLQEVAFELVNREYKLRRLLK